MGRTQNRQYAHGALQKRRRAGAAALFMLAAMLIAIPGPARASEPDGKAVAQATATLPGGGRFFDDDGSVHEPSIEAIAAIAVTLGCNPPYRTAYCPHDPVTREQMAAFLSRALGLTDTGGGNHFTDDDASIFENDIARLAAAGVTKGCNPPINDRFCPRDYVTRGQMAAFLVRAMGYTDDGAGNVFDDVAGSVFEADIARLAVAGVTKGCNPPDNTNFCPNDLVTRDQMATFIARALGLATPAVPERPFDSDGTYLNVYRDAGNHGCSYEDGETCHFSYNVSGEFYIATGWFVEDWSTLPSAVQTAFRSSATRVELTFDGIPLTLHDWGFEVEGDIASKWWSYVFPDWLDGSHNIEVMLIDDNYDYLWTADVTVTGDGPGYDALSTAADEPVASLSPARESGSTGSAAAWSANQP